MTIRRVDINSTAPIPDGSSWALAYPNLQDAISASSNNDTIWVAKGTYKPSYTGDQTKSFTLKFRMLLYGGFNGTETSLSERDWETNVTILSGDLNGDDTPDFANHSDNSYHVISGVAGSTVDGFTITGGNAEAVGETYGGAIKTGVAIISNCIFTLNQAGTAGGAISTSSAGTIITNCQFTNNRAYDVGTTTYTSGGAIFYSGSSAIIISTCTFTNNKAINGAGIFSSIVNISTSTFEDNIAYQTGGGICLSGSYTSYISRSLFSGNDAQGAGWGGGGVSFFSGATVYFTENVFYNNMASTSINGIGGAIYPRSTAVACYVYNCVFVGNTSVNIGGAIGTYVDASNTLTMSTIGCTFYNNTADKYGGAIGWASATGSPGGTVNHTIQNTIFWQNTASFGGNDGDTVYATSAAGATANITIKYCDVQNGNTASNITLTGAGTSNLTYDTSNINATPNWVNANKYDEWFTENAGFKLSATSPCIDNGDITGLSATYATRDILYHSRPISARSDIGAYEYYCMCGGRLRRGWFNSNQSACPYESISGAGMIIPANDDHVLLWEDYTYGFTECTDTNNGNKYIYRTVKTSSSSTTRHAGCANGEAWNSTDHPDESGETLSGWTETISGGGTSVVSFVTDKLQLFFKSENVTTKKISYLRNTKQNYLKDSTFDYWVNFKRTSINSDFAIWFGLFNSVVDAAFPNSIIFTVTSGGAPYLLVSNSVWETKYSVGSNGDIVLDTEYWVRIKSDGITMAVNIYTSYADMVAETGSIRTLSITVSTIVGTITCDRFGFMNQAQELLACDETWLVTSVDGDICDDWNYTTSTQNVYYQIYSTEFGDALLLQTGYNFRLQSGGRLLLR